VQTRALQALQVKQQQQLQQQQQEQLCGQLDACVLQQACLGLVTLHAVLELTAAIHLLLLLLVVVCLLPVVRCQCLAQKKQLDQHRA
jgi:hypothetical protein